MFEFDQEPQTGVISVALIRVLGSRNRTNLRNEPAKATWKLSLKYWRYPIALDLRVGVLEIVMNGARINELTRGSSSRSPNREHREEWRIDPIVASVSCPQASNMQVLYLVSFVASRLQEEVSRTFVDS